jgi:hypothetical protein
MAARVIPDDLIRPSFVEHGQSLNLCLDRADAGEEGVGAESSLPCSIQQHNLGFMLTGREPGCLAGEQCRRARCGYGS